MAPLSVKDKWRWIFLENGECSVPLTGTWPTPMLSVVSSAVEVPSLLQKEPTFWKDVTRSGKPNFTAQGLSPSCGIALWLPWAFLTAPMGTRPLWSAQVKGRATWYWGCFLSEMSLRAESVEKLPLKVRYFREIWNMVILIHSFFRSRQEV